MLFEVNSTQHAIFRGLRLLILTCLFEVTWAVYFMKRTFYLKKNCHNTQKSRVEKEVKSNGNLWLCSNFHPVLFAWWCLMQLSFSQEIKVRVKQNGTFLIYFQCALKHFPVTLNKTGIKWTNEKLLFMEILGVNPCFPYHHMQQRVWRHSCLEASATSWFLQNKCIIPFILKIIPN